LRVRRNSGISSLQKSGEDARADEEKHFHSGGGGKSEYKLNASTADKGDVKKKIMYLPYTRKLWSTPDFTAHASYGGFRKKKRG